MTIKIAIADDHRVFIDGMKALLKEVEGVQVIADAENGEQLLAKIETLRPDVLLTDIQMPVMDGIGLTTQMQKRFPQVKVIALTMLNESMFIRKMLEAGASGYLIKTVDKEELIKAIRTVAGGEKYFSQEVANQLMNNFAGAEENNPLSVLTKREKEVLIHIAEGLTDKEIAEKVFLSPLTITTHRKNILSKLGLKNKVELARFAIAHKLIS